MALFRVRIVVDPCLGDVVFDVSFRKVEGDELSEQAGYAFLLPV